MIVKHKEMASEDKVTLHGFWASPYARRVELALKVKGIPYEYVEEDLANKSQTLIGYNPVHKKVPVLVHNGKPICESLVIIEYIDETWKDGPKLLPEDPYHRAQVRFWAAFLQHQLIEGMVTVFKLEGEAQKKVIAEVNEKLQLLEEHLKSFEPSYTCINKTHFGILDLVLFSVFGGEDLQEDVLGIRVVELEKTPLLFSWVVALNDHPLVKESTVPKDKLVGFLKFLRHRALSSS